MERIRFIEAFKDEHTPSLYRLERSYNVETDEIQWYWRDFTGAIISLKSYEKEVAYEKEYQKMILVENRKKKLERIKNK